MKKLITILLLCVAVLMATVAVHADTSPFTVDITGTPVISAGETVTYRVTVQHIQDELSLIAVELELTYDTSVFEFVSGKIASSLAEWDLPDAVKEEDGVLTINAADESVKNGIGKDSVLAYDLTFTVKTTEAKSGDITVTYAGAGALKDGSLASYEGRCGSLTATIRQPLPSPSSLVWQDSVAIWDKMEHVKEFRILLFRNGAEFKIVDAEGSATSYDFTADMTESGIYTFRVVAIPDANAPYQESESGFSAERKIVAKLKIPQIKVTTDLENGGLKYQITDTNPSAAVGGYLIKIFESGSDTAVKTVEVTKLAGNIACDGTALVIDKSYVASVAAVPANPSDNLTSDSSAVTTAVKVHPKLVKLAITTQPLLSYKEEQTLDLSSMIVTLTFEGNLTKEVSYAAFADNFLSASRDHGAVLALSDDGKTITVTYGSQTATTEALVVESNACKHPDTRVDVEEATCGKDGSEKTVCNVCQAVIKTVVLPRHNDHTFGEWVITQNPTDVFNGERVRICEVCEYKVTEVIPAIVVTAPPVTLPPDTTTPPETTDVPPTVTTTPPETTPGNSQGGSNLNDLSKIFLFVIGGIFVVIILFLIIGFWFESSRSKRRRSRARAKRNAGNNRRSHTGRR
ncbi:MAG: hypothetical protein E7618_07060 [Ruminococcaceae bacterium]|nr:hypothetical protein [Oscillospiraceae bacterium]